MKVGKAIYNILSQSKDVQSNFPFNTTDYSPTGTELVTNGDFSAAGSNLVDNPNFTDTGSELMPTIGTIVNAGGGSITLISGISYSSTSDGTSGSSIRPKIDLATTSSKSYKLVITPTSTPTGTTNCDFYDGASYLFQDYDFTTTKEIYFVDNGSVFLSFDGAQIYDVPSFTISVKELGEDWTVIQNSGGSVSFADNQCEIITDGVNGQGIRQFILTTGKSYKVVIDIASNTNKFQVRLGDQIAVVSGSGVQTFYGVATATDLLIYRETGEASDVVLNSVSVQELGEGWSVVDGAAGDTVTFGDSFAQFNKTDSQAVYLQQDYALSLGVYHKLKYTILSNTYTGGGTELGVSSVGAYGQSAIASTVGTHTVYLKVTNTTPTASLRFYSNDTGGSLKITDISVEEMVLNKIFPELAPPDINAPYVVYSVVSNSPSDTKNANGDIDTASIEVYGFQDTYNKAVDLGVSVRAALDRKTGTYNTIEIQSTNYVNEQMDVNEARKLWAAIQDYSIRIKNL